ncbi:hypothetical protein [Streptomyces sp. NPDC020917]|uniref:hypothetical protein n=1 Tax=Streptomyces sp. NPDC020917 TaxID=3365102 RepID=UPI0037BAB5B9
MGRLRDALRGVADTAMDSPMPAARANAIAQVSARIAVEQGHPGAAAAFAVVSTAVAVAEGAVGRSHHDPDVTYATFHEEPKRGRRS